MNAYKHRTQKYLENMALFMLTVIKVDVTLNEKHVSLYSILKYKKRNILKISFAKVMAKFIK